MMTLSLVLPFLYMFGVVGSSLDYYAPTHGPSLIGLRPNGYVMFRRFELDGKMKWESLDKVTKPPRGMKFDELVFEPEENTYWGSGSKGTWFMHNEMWRRDTKKRFKALAVSQGFIWGITEKGALYVRDKSVVGPLSDWSKMDGPTENVIERETYGVKLENPVAGRLVSLTGSDERVWGIDEIGQLWNMNGDVWVRFTTQTPLKSVATDRKGLSLWMVGPHGRMLHTEVSDDGIGIGEIKEIGGDFDRVFAGDGVVVGVNYYNQAFLLDKNNQFQMVGENLKRISVIPTGDPILKKKPNIDRDAHRKRRRDGSDSGIQEAVSMKPAPKQNPKHVGKKQKKSKKKKPKTKMDL